MDCLAALERYLPSVIIPHLIRKQHNEERSSSSHHLLPPTRQEDLFAAVCVVCDVSRVVTLLESDVTTLVNNHTTGVEKEKEDSRIERLKACFGRLMRIVSDEGGDVFKFAGDVMIALWPPPSSTLLMEKEEEKRAGDKEEGFASVERRALSAVRCAFSMLDEFVSFNLAAVKNGVPQLKIGIGIGDILILHLGRVSGRVEYVAVGDAVMQAFKALHCAETGCVTTSGRLGDVVREQFSMRKEPFLEEGYVILNKLCVNRFPPAVKRGGIQQPSYITRKDQQIMREELELRVLLKSYIPQAISYHNYFKLGVPEDEQWYDEVRPISVLVASLGLGEQHPLSASCFCEKAMIEVHNAMVIALQESISYTGGSINKVVIDDKKCTLMVVYGLPGALHGNEPIRATLAALLLCKKLCELNLIGSFGITLGKAFCGLVGNETRREYVVLGDIVNRAAVLMQAALTEGGGVLCDKDTMMACQGILNFIPKTTCEMKEGYQTTAALNVFRPYPSGFSPLSNSHLFSENVFRSIYNQQMRNYGLANAITGLKVYFNLLNNDYWLEKDPSAPGNVAIDNRGKEIFCAHMINGSRTECVVSFATPTAGALDSEYWKCKMKDGGVLLVPDTRPIERNNGAAALSSTVEKQHSQQKVCEVVNSAGGGAAAARGASGSSNPDDLILNNIGDSSIVTASTGVEKREEEGSSSPCIKEIAAVRELHQVEALQMLTMGEQPPGDCCSARVEIHPPLNENYGDSLLTTSTGVGSPFSFAHASGSELDPTLSQPHLNNAGKEISYHVISQCSLIPIPYALNDRDLDRLSMSSILHILGDVHFLSALQKRGEKTPSSVVSAGTTAAASSVACLCRAADYAATDGGGEKQLKELLQVLFKKISLPHLNNAMLHYQLGEPVNEWFCLIAVPVDGNIANLNASSPRILLQCNCAKTATEMMEQACALAAAEGCLNIPSGSSSSDWFCLNVQGTRAFFPLFDSMPMDTRLLPLVLKEVCMEHIGGSSEKSSSSASCVQPLSQCGIIELVLARTDSTVGIGSFRMQTQLTLLQMKASLVLEHKGGVALLEGAPGVGKTDILSRFAARTLPGSAIVHFTASSSLSYNIPYGSLGALLGQFLDDMSVKSHSAPASSCSVGGEWVGENVVPESTTTTTTSLTLRDQALLKELQGYPGLLMHAHLVNDILGTDIPVPTNEKGESTDGDDVDVEEAARKWRLDILIHLLRCMSHHVNPVLIIDNAHLLDESSWELVLQSLSLGPNGGPLPMLIILAFRPLNMCKGVFSGMPGEASKLMLQNRGAVFLKVDGLPSEEVERLVVDELLGAATAALPVSTAETSVSTDLLMAVEEACHGNPFIIKELMGHLKMSKPPPGLEFTEIKVKTEEGEGEMVGSGKFTPTLSVDWNSSVLQANPPSNVTAFILDILSRISYVQLLILKTASVIGKEFSFWLLFDIYPIKEHLFNLEAELDVIEDLGLLVSTMNSSSTATPRRTTSTTTRVLKAAAAASHTHEGRKRFKVFRFTYGFMREVLQSLMPLSQRNKLVNQFRHLAMVRQQIEMATMPESVETALKSYYPVEHEPINVSQLKILKQGVAERVMGGCRVFQCSHFERGGIKERDWEPRVCFLTQNGLCVCRISSGQCKSVQFLHLSGSSVVAKLEKRSGALHWLVASSVSAEPMFCVQTLHWSIGGVEHKNEKQTFFFIADSKESALRWVLLIRFAIVQSVEQQLLLSENVEAAYDLQGGHCEEEKSSSSMRRKLVEYFKNMFSSSHNEVNKWLESPVILRSQLSSSSKVDGMLVVVVKHVVVDRLSRSIVGMPALFCELKLDNVQKRTEWHIISYNVSSTKCTVSSDESAFLAVTDGSKRHVKMNSCSPDFCSIFEWNEEVSFTVSVNQLRSSSLAIRVMNKDIFLSNDYLGSAVLLLSDLLQEPPCADTMMSKRLELISGNGELEIDCRLKLPADTLDNINSEKIPSSRRATSDYFNDIVEVDGSTHYTTTKQFSGYLKNKNMIELMVGNESPTCEPFPVEVMVAPCKLRPQPLSDPQIHESEFVRENFLISSSCSNTPKRENSHLIECGISSNWIVKDTHPLLDRIFLMGDPKIEAQDGYLLKGWEFDIFTLEPGELTLFVGTLFAQSHLPKIFSIPITVFTNFILTVQQIMSRHPGARYHNYLHAADIMHATWTILYHRGADSVERWKCPLAPTSLSPIGDLSLLISAFCHDLDHPGLSNAYHINIGTTLGISYGDTSPLEQHHIAVLWFILRCRNCNILSNCTREEIKKAKHIMHKAILKTDMKCHNQNQQSMVDLMHLVSHPLDTPRAFFLSTEMASTCCEVILHAADISTCGRPWKTCHRWTEMLYLEFDEQARKEESANLHVSVMQGPVCKFQPNFIDFVYPYFVELDRMIPNVMGPWLLAVKRNKELWVEECRTEEEEGPSSFH